jgi:hypothetical protein
MLVMELKAVVTSYAGQAGALTCPSSGFHKGCIFEADRLPVWPRNNETYRVGTGLSPR